MASPPDKERNQGLSRRDFLKHTAKNVVALPFVLAIPSNAPNIVTERERLQPFKDREATFQKNLEEKIAQITPIKPPPPPPPKTEPPPRITYNTAYDTMKHTTMDTSTNSGTPPKADDMHSDTYFDGNTTDYKTDYR